MGPFTAGRQFHDRDAHLVFQSGLHNALAAVDQIFDIVQRIEIANRGDAVFLKQLGMKTDDIAGLRIEPDHIDAA